MPAPREVTSQGGGGALWLSDGNRRTEGHAAATREIGRHLAIGASGRALGYRQAGVGYFSPDRSTCSRQPPRFGSATRSGTAA